MSIEAFGLSLFIYVFHVTKLTVFFFNRICFKSPTAPHSHHTDATDPYLRKAQFVRNKKKKRKGLPGYGRQFECARKSMISYCIGPPRSRYNMVQGENQQFGDRMFLTRAAPLVMKSSAS